MNAAGAVDSSVLDVHCPPDGHDSVTGVESPSHAIRADADPLARSATSVVITLADKYTYDCPVRILIYPSGRSKSPLSSL